MLFRSTDNQVHLLGILMVAGGAALSGELIFAVCLFLFTLLISLSAGLGVIEAAVGPHEVPPIRAALGPLSVGIVFALLGALSFFVLFPRLNWNIAARGSASGLLGTATTGFADTVRLGSGSGTLKTNPRVVLRAALSPDPDRSQLERYWLGRTFRTFDGREWTGAPQAAAVPRGRVTLVEGVPPEGSVVQRIELLPAYGAHAAIALEQPLSFTQAATLTAGGSARTGLVRVPGTEVAFAPRGSSYRYVATSLAPGNGAWLPAALTGEERAGLLQLPEHLDPRIGALARSVVGGERNPLRAARLLERHLQRSYRYTLELEGEQADPLAHFLFTRKAGHCEHFATALAVLLRASGVPARVATGFFGGERAGAQYVVRAGDAHAWVQAHVEGAGFVTLDGTPLEFRTSQTPALTQRLFAAYETLEELWRGAVLDYDFRDQVDLVRTLRPRPAPTRAAQPVRRPLPSLGAWWARLLAAAGTYGLGWLLYRQLRRAAPHPATVFREGAERILRRARLSESPDELLESTSARLVAKGHPDAPRVEQIRTRYLEARFGQRPLTRRQADALLRELARELHPRHGGARRAGQR